MRDTEEYNNWSGGEDPIQLFDTWYKIAENSGLELPESMALSTIANDGTPSSRIVLLKNYDSNGFVFFTNYESSKAEEIERNPFVSLLFFWVQIQKQIRIKGKIKKISKKSSDEYFKTRQRGSQIGAWASSQSREIPDRKFLEDACLKYSCKFQEIDIPRPEYWGGYSVMPDTFEFWQGKPDRLHERYYYTRKGDGWKTTLLAP